MKLNYKNRHIMLDYLFDRVSQDGRPLAISIVDPAGRLLESILMDGAPQRMLEFGFHKAYTAAKMERTTADLRTHLEKQETDISWFCDSKLTLLRGGAPIYDSGHNLIGAIGMSGWKSEKDQELANAAAALLQNT